MNSINQSNTVTSQNIIDEEDFLLSFNDDNIPFLYDDNNNNNTDDNNNNNILNMHEQQIQMINHDETSNSTTGSSATLENKSNSNSTSATELIVLLKQAKGRDDQFESHFPPSLLCHPYKYDLKVIGHLENYQQSKLILNLVDAETLVIPNVTLPTKPNVTLPNKKTTLEAVSVEQIEEINSNERLIRFTFNLCSFHFKRRPFRLELTQIVNSSCSKRLYLSDPFQTFARRREHHQSFNSNSNKTEHVKNNTTTSAPLTPDSNNSNSSGSIQSPKSEKQGVKRSISSVTSSYYPLNKNRNIAPHSPISSNTTTTILNPASAVPHFAGAYPPYMYSANFAAAAAAVYHQEMAQQYAMQYATPKMPLYYPQWASYPQPNQMVFTSPNTSPVSPPSNVIMQQERSTDILGALIAGDSNNTENKSKKDSKLIHHTPLNFVQAVPTSSVVEASERASLAIQLLKTLTPVERQTVNMFINGSPSI